MPDFRGGGGGAASGEWNETMLGQVGQQAAPQVPGLLQMAQAAMGDGGDFRGGGNGQIGGYGPIPVGADDRARYFTAEGEPIISSAPDSAMSGFFPQYLGDRGQGYRIPSDTGGFFSAEELFKRSPRGSVPEIGTFGANRPSTNNWRLLGRGPGWIMRNGQLIDTGANGTSWGGPAGFTPSGGNSGEQAMLSQGTQLGGGKGLGVPNILQAGLGTDVTYGWPGADQWFNAGRTSSG